MTQEIEGSLEHVVNYCGQILQSVHDHTEINQKFPDGIPVDEK
jgi:hypothetical protein